LFHDFESAKKTNEDIRRRGSPICPEVANGNCCRNRYPAIGEERDFGRSKLSVIMPCDVRADFVSKMTTAEEEADETQYWLELLIDAGIVTADVVAPLIDESDQLVRTFVASINTARGSPR
jgi:hypothetical protein